MASALAVRIRLARTAYADLIDRCVASKGWRGDDVAAMLVAVDGNQAWLEELFERFQSVSPYGIHGKRDYTTEPEVHGYRFKNFVIYHAAKDRREATRAPR